VRQNQKRRIEDLTNSIVYMETMYLAVEGYKKEIVEKNLQRTTEELCNLIKAISLTK
jgi:hypothetical protein